MLKKYRFHFDICGLLLFLAIMIPNFIWFAVPAPNDVLRADSVTAPLDTLASICQVCMIVMLCAFQNVECKKIRISPYVIAAIACCFLYFLCWIVYYAGIVNAVVILGLTVPPCLTFLFYAIDRRNTVALIPISIFTICHFLYGVANFII